jgi:hypothetical protein
VKLVVILVSALVTPIFIAFVANTVCPGRIFSFGTRSGECSEPQYFWRATTKRLSYAKLNTIMNKSNRKNITKENLTEQIMNLPTSITAFLPSILSPLTSLALKTFALTHT